MRRAQLGASCLLLGFALPFCGRAETTAPETPGGAGGMGGMGGMADAGGGSTQDPTPLGGSAGADEPVVPPDPGMKPMCTSELHALSRPHAALMLLLDSSGSMFAPAANGQPRIEGVVEGLTSFAADPESTDISVGIQYLPIRRADVPAECRTHEDCGPGGPCVGTCLGLMSAGQPILCGEDAHCGGTAPCVLNGEPSICSDEYSCDPAMYAEPAVPIEPLADNAAALTGSIAEQTPLGTRPVSPALEAMIAHARAQSEAKPGRSTAVLLIAADEPVGCGDTTERVAAIASEGLSGTPVVRTFALGISGHVFPWVADFLNAVAEAGGTQSATFVSGEEDVPTSLLGALREIRDGLLSCTFELPEPGSGDELDPDLVRVEVTDEHTEAELVPRVTSGDDCSARGGWHYDTQGASRSIVLCPTTCRDLLARPAAELGARFGCEPLETAVP